MNCMNIRVCEDIDGIPITNHVFAMVPVINDNDKKVGCKGCVNESVISLADLSFYTSQYSMLFNYHDLVLGVENVDIEIEANGNTENTVNDDINVIDVIDSGLVFDYNSDRNLNKSLNLSMNLDTTFSASSNSSNILENITSVFSVTNESENRNGLIDIEDPNVVLSELKAKNSERLVIAQININAVERKFQSLVSLIKDKVDIIMISETKLDGSFPTSQFEIEGFSSPYRLDRDSYGGGIMIFFPDYLPCRRIESYKLPGGVEGMFIEPST